MARGRRSPQLIDVGARPARLRSNTGSLSHVTQAQVIEETRRRALTKTPPQLRGRFPLRRRRDLNPRFPRGNSTLAGWCTRPDYATSPEPHLEAELDPPTIHLNQVGGHRQQKQRTTGLGKRRDVPLRPLLPAKPSSPGCERCSSPNL